jgi:Flp pilus assembly protein TadD
MGSAHERRERRNVEAQRAVPVRQRQALQAMPRPDRARRFGGDVVRSRASEGLEAHRAGRLDDAERAYVAALAVDPDDRRIEHNLAVIRMQRGDYAAALPVFERGVQWHPDEPEFHANLGLAYAGVDRFDDAIDVHRRGLALDPNRAGAWSNLGLALVQARRDDEAIEAFGRAIAIEPGHARARWHLATTRLSRGDMAGWDDADARLDLLEPGTAPGIEGVPRWDGGAVRRNDDRRRRRAGLWRHDPVDPAR